MLHLLPRHQLLYFCYLFKDKKSEWHGFISCHASPWDLLRFSWGGAIKQLHYLQVEQQGGGLSGNVINKWSKLDVCSAHTDILPVQIRSYSQKIQAFSNRVKVKAVVSLENNVCFYVLFGAVSINTSCRSIQM